MTTTHSAPPSPVSFAEAFRFWLKLGFISFGGPAGQIAIMHQELVEKRRWISERRFLHALNYCMTLPGPEAQQLATYIGWLMHRTWGGIVAGGLFVLPSLFILIALSWIYVAFGNLPQVAGVLYGVKPAVTAIVMFAAWRIGSRTLRNAVMWGIAGAAFVAIFALHLPFPLIVLIAALVGWVGGQFSPNIFSTGGGHGNTHQGFGPALIDDDTPTPAHARLNWPRLAWVTAIGFAMWAVVMGALISQVGWQGTLTQMGWFFTKAALLTFGGAYAVLPYVFQGAVEHHGWLTAAQMIDGLALGETTPGPLIMVVAFVGFVGGWGAELFGSDQQFLAGTVAATVVTYFTFLPSFPFHLDRRAHYRDHASPTARNRTVVRYQCCRGRRHRESRRIFRLSRFVARGAAQWIRMAGPPHRVKRRHRAIPLPLWRDSSHCRQRCRGTGLRNVYSAATRMNVDASDGIVRHQETENASL